MSASTRVLEALSSEEPIYAVLDGARDPGIVSWIVSTEAPAWCLYAGKLSPDLQAAAPWLLRVGRGHPYTETLFERAWGESMGFFLASPVPPRALRFHLRRHLIARTEDGRRLVFRYYDPRVLRVYLAHCTSNELRAFFGPISTIVVESEERTELIFRHPDGAASQAPVRPSGGSSIKW